MAYRETIAYYVVCSSCEEFLDILDNGGLTLFSEKEDADQAASEYDWIIRDGRHYCDACWHLDDNGNVVIDEEE